MAGLRAALRKDLKLFWRGIGTAAVLLPLLLLAALWLGMGDLSAQSYVQPFPVAMRDEDGTVMSRALISQVRRVELFSEVRTLDGTETDREALEDGAAAVVTIPKDFFYDLYWMEDCPVRVTLNGEMELESALFRSVFCSVMDIVEAAQSATLGVYRFAWGELDDAQERAMYEEASYYLIQDALGRQSDVFDDTAAQADLAGALQRRLLACAMSVLLFFFALSAAKTLPEERELGIVDRWRAAGGSSGLFLCSKYLTALAAALPSVILLAVLFCPERPVALILFSALLLAGIFGVLVGLAALVTTPAAVQRWGNLMLLLSLAVGGTLWPRAALSAPLSALGRLTLPHFTSVGVEALARGSGLFRLLSLCWPLFVLGAAGLCLGCLPVGRGTGRRGKRRGETQADVPAGVPARGLLSRLWGLTRFKLWRMAGGGRGASILLLAALVCGMAAAGGQRAQHAQLHLAVCDLDGSETAEELVERLSALEGLSLTAVDTRRGEELLLTGEVEGILTIEPGYRERLLCEEKPLVQYEASAGALSVQGVREMVAGQVAVQRSRLRASEQAEELLGRSLSDAEEKELLACVDAVEPRESRLYEIKTSDGAEGEQPFVPDAARFAVLAVFFTLLTACAWSAGRGGRRVERRMGAIPRGRLLALGSDCVSLTCLGGAVWLAVLLPGGLPAWSEVWTMAAYSFCAASLTLLLSRLTAMEGRIDGLAPFFALILCLLGGCFMELEQLIPQLERLSWVIPTGLAVRGSEGAAWAVPLLLLEGGAFLTLCTLKREE